ncbi:MAG: phosphoribosyltransferase [Clostridiales bacterium]|nr:phosphoribosyltransferase [Clostridiales bacterium]
MNSKNKVFSVSLPKNPSISMNVIPGHFTTNHFHLSHYLDLDNLKTNATLAKKVAKELAEPYLVSTLIDTIVCMEGTELIGAYLAEELSKKGTSAINTGRDIYVIKPMSNVHRQLTFRSNIQELVTNHRVLLLVSSISSGTTLRTALELLNYYGANLVGISALFNSLHDDLDIGQEIHYLFTPSDIPEYRMYRIKDCELCKTGRKLDAIIIQGGYTTL